MRGGIEIVGQKTLPPRMALEDATRPRFHGTDRVELFGIKNSQARIESWLGGGDSNPDDVVQRAVNGLAPTGSPPDENSHCETRPAFVASFSCARVKTRNAAFRLSNFSTTRSSLLSTCVLANRRADETVVRDDTSSPQIERRTRLQSLTSKCACRDRVATKEE